MAATRHHRYGFLLNFPRALILNYGPPAHREGFLIASLTREQICKTFAAVILITSPKSTKLLVHRVAFLGLALAFPAHPQESATITVKYFSNSSVYQRPIFNTTDQSSQCLSCPLAVLRIPQLTPLVTRTPHKGKDRSPSLCHMNFFPILINGNFSLCVHFAYLFRYPRRKECCVRPLSSASLPGCRQTMVEGDGRMEMCAVKNCGNRQRYGCLDSTVAFPQPSHHHRQTTGRRTVFWMRSRKTFYSTINSVTLAHDDDDATLARKLHQSAFLNYPNPLLVQKVGIKG